MSPASFRKKCIVIILASLLPLFSFAEKIRYSVSFEGLEDAQALKAVQSVSKLTSFKKHAPASINALRYRAESDIPEL